MEWDNDSMTSALLLNLAVLLLWYAWERYLPELPPVARNLRYKLEI